jgi:xylan 1,4-beta-xylosidase
MITSCRPRSNRSNTPQAVLIAACCAAILFPCAPSALVAQNRDIQRQSVDVDFGAAGQRVVSMAGLLRGADERMPPQELIEPLGIHLWKGDLKQYDRAMAIGALYEYVLSTSWPIPGSPKWRQQGPPYKNAANPDWSAWERHVRDEVERHRGKRIYWDIWNEPNGSKYWEGSRELFFETFARACRVIRDVSGPDTMIGGPCLAHSYDREYIQALLEHCLSARAEVNFLSWHELDGSRKARIRDVEAHLKDARARFVDNARYRPLRLREIHINEYLPKNAQYSPGHLLGYLYYLEKGGADAASRAAWPDSKFDERHPSPLHRNGANNSLDGMLSPEDNFAPRSQWWALKNYAQTLNSRVPSKPSDPTIVSFASRGADPQIGHVLIGRLAEDNAPAVADVSLTIAGLPPGIAKIRAVAEQFPDWGERPLPQPVVLFDGELPVVDRAVALVVKDMRLHEAVHVLLTR